MRLGEVGGVGVSEMAELGNNRPEVVEAESYMYFQKKTSYCKRTRKTSSHLNYQLVSKVENSKNRKSLSDVRQMSCGGAAAVQDEDGEGVGDGRGIRPGACEPGRARGMV